MQDFAFIQTAPGRIFVGYGPFEQLPFRRPDRPAFFITDFFLDEARPWMHPDTWEEIMSFRATGPAPEVGWAEIDSTVFERLFESAQHGIARGDFQKIVPVIFEHGVISGDLWPHVIDRLESLPSGL